MHSQLKKKRHYITDFENNIGPVDEQQSADQFKILMDEMLVAAEQYEISFTQGNSYSRHNSSYWKKNHYLGLGVAFLFWGCDCGMFLIM